MKYLQYIRNICVQLGMPYPDEVVDLFYKLRKEANLKGRPLNVIIGALIYIVARKYAVPLSFDDITKVLKVDKKELIARTKTIIKENNFSIAPPPVDAYLKMIAQKLSLPEPVVEDALVISRRLENDIMTKKETIVAGAIYASAKAHGLKISQHEIALASNTTEVSIRKIVKKIKELGLQPVPLSN